MAQPSGTVYSSTAKPSAWEKFDTTIKKALVMHPYLAELIGTTVLILLGNGVVANVVLSGTKGHGAGWIVITAGWGFAVFTAVVCVADVSGAHINPAVTIGIAAAGVGDFGWADVPGYLAAQMIGAVLGAGLVYFFYQPHYAATDDADAKLGTFCTGPAIRQTGSRPVQRSRRHVSFSFWPCW